MKTTARFLRMLLPLAAVCAMSPALADPPPWAPAHGYRAKPQVVREYQYLYYPARQIYYAPDTRMWFWLGGNGWQAGVSLPLYLQGTVVGSSVPVVLHSSRPYVEHIYVEEHYGRPWREAHGYGRHHDRYHDDWHDRHH